LDAYDFYSSLSNGSYNSKDKDKNYSSLIEKTDSSESPAQEAPSSTEGWHAAFGALSAIPYAPIGGLAFLGNAALYASEGNWSGFCLSFLGPISTASIVGSAAGSGPTQVLGGQFVNRVYDSRYGVVEGVSGPLGKSFSPGSGIPTTATEAIAERGLGVYNTNNAEMGVVYRALKNIPAEARTSLEGTAPELLINSRFFKYLEKVFEHPVVK
jgi:hypothetical protein